MRVHSILRSGEDKRIADAEKLAVFAGGHARVGGQAVVVVESGFRRPGGEVRTAKIAERFLEAREDLASLRMAWGNGTARARIAALEFDVTDPEAHRAAFFLAEELVFPERGHAVDFERRAEAQAHFLERHARKQIAGGLQTRGGNDGRAVSNSIIGKTFRRMPHDNLLIKILAEPGFGSGSVAWKIQSDGPELAGVGGRGEGDAAQIGRVACANEKNRRRAFAVHPLAIDRVERPGAIELETASGADTCLLHVDRIERFDGMESEVCKARRSDHLRILAKENDRYRKAGCGSDTLWLLANCFAKGMVALRRANNEAKRTH